MEIYYWRRGQGITSIVQKRLSHGLEGVDTYIPAEQ